MLRLGKVLRTYRVVAELGQQQVAQEIGISKATLSRLERLGEMDGATLAKVLRWILSEAKETQK